MRLGIGGSFRDLPKSRLVRLVLGGQCFVGLVTRRGKTTTSNHQSTTGNQQEWLFDPLIYLFSLSSKMGEAYPIQEALAQDWRGQKGHKT
jgi:hypothetical protein